VQIEAALDRSGILVLNDTADPGWTATVDGHPTEWIAANYLFRGVIARSRQTRRPLPLPAQKLPLGAAISGLTLAGLLAIGLVLPRSHVLGRDSRPISI
jgi:hypothetical protein